MEIVYVLDKRWDKGESSRKKEEIGEVVHEAKTEDGKYGILEDQLLAASAEAPRQYYPVARGRSPGVYTSWEEVEPLVSWFRGSRFKAFRNREDAVLFTVRENNKSS